MPSLIPWIQSVSIIKPRPPILLILTQLLSIAKVKLVFLELIQLRENNTAAKLCKYRELTLPGSNWGAADTAQNNNPISPKTSYFVVLCLLSVQMNCSICLPNRERCDTSNKFKQSSCSDTKKSNQSFFAVLRHRLQLLVEIIQGFRNL